MFVRKDKIKENEVGDGPVEKTLIIGAGSIPSEVMGKVLLKRN